MAAVVEYRKFSLTNLGNNNNKFWNVTLFDNGDVQSVWGRQGDPGQTKTWSGAGRSFMEQKIREKEKKGYRENLTIESTAKASTSPQPYVANVKLADIARQQIRTQNPAVLTLIDYLVQVNAHNIGQATGGKITYNKQSGAFETTQGIIVAHQVDRAAELLSVFADLISEGKDFSDQDKLDLNEYLSLIPRDFGRKRLTPQQILPDVASVRKEQDILDGLRASFAGACAPAKDATAPSKKKDDTPKIFSVALNVVNSGTEVDRITRYYEQTKKTMHQSYRYRLKKIYAVSIDTVTEAFEKFGKKVGNIKELFHGTKCSNCLSILKQGLIIPPATSSHCTGRLYGNGVYASDISSKALNYATNFWTGGGNTSRIFMFIVDFAMGKIYYPNGSSGVFPMPGYDSTFAKAGAGGVYNNEMIVYDTRQVNLKYLLEFE